MKTFVIEHEGVYLGGISIVTAGSKESAKKLFIEEKPGMKESKIYDIYEVDTTSRSVLTVFTGDY